MNVNFEFVETPVGNYLINEFDLIGKYIKNNLYWEKHIYDFYSKIILPNFIIVDAGANIGYHTIQFAKLGKIVHSFEPQKFVFNQLCTNILFNGVSDKVYAHNCGVGKEEEIAYMSSIEEQDFGNGLTNYGGRRLLQNETITPHSESEVVNVISIDSLNLISCDLIKMDIQGYESLALEGASKLIQNNYPIILMESSLSEIDKEAISKLNNYEYECYRYLIGTQEDCILINKKNKNYDSCIKHIHELSTKYSIRKDL